MLTEHDITSSPLVFLWSVPSASPKPGYMGGLRQEGHQIKHVHSPAVGGLTPWEIRARP